MKKEWIYVVVMLIMVSAVSATTLLFNDELYSGDTVSVNNNVMTIIISSNIMQLWLTYQNQDYYVSKGSCAALPNLRACFDSTTYDNERHEYKASLRIFQLIPVLTLTRTIDDTSINLDEEIHVSAEIKNTGNKTAYGAVFEDSIPEGLTVSSYGTLNYADNKVSWTGDVIAGNTKEFSYTLTPTKKLYRTNKAKLTYDNTIEQKTVYSAAATFDVSSIIQTTQTLTPTELYPEKEFTYDFTLRNLIDDYLTVDSLIIVFPPSIKLITKPITFTQVDNYTYSYSDTLSSYENKSFTFKFESMITGTYDISPRITYSADSTFTEFLSKTSFTISNKKAKVTSETTSNEQIESGMKKRIKLYVQNTNPLSIIKNIEVTTYSNLTYIPLVRVPLINASSSKKIYDIPYIAPYVDTPTQFPLKTEVKYMTVYGEEFSSTLNFNIIIIPKKDLTITHQISKSNPESDELITVTVSVNNIRQSKIDNVHVYDSFNEELSVTGITQRTLWLNPESDTDVYTYSLKMPVVLTKKTYSINTTVEYNDDGVYNEIKYSSQVTLNPKDYKLTISKTIEDSEIYIGEVVDIIYTITNNDNIKFSNISIQYPKENIYDVNIIPHGIDFISPGDVIQLTLEKVRFKRNISNIVNKSTIFFTDENGIRGSKDTQTISITPKTTKLYEPLFFVNKTWDEETKMTTILIQNLGQTQVQSTLNDKTSWNLLFLPYQIKEVKFNQETLDDTKSILTYNLNGIMYESYSNFVAHTLSTTTSTIPVVTTTSTTHTVTTINSITTTTEKVAQIINKKSKDDEEPGFWSKFIDKLKKVFSFFDIKKEEK